MKTNWLSVVLGYGSLALFAMGILHAALNKPLAWVYVLAAVLCVFFVTHLDDKG